MSHNIPIFCFSNYFYIYFYLTFAILNTVIGKNLKFVKFHKNDTQTECFI